MAHSIARELQSEQGWTDETLLGVVLDYIENQDSDAAFRDYLAERSENEEDDDHAVITAWFSSDGFKEDPMGALELIHTRYKEIHHVKGITLAQAVLDVAKGNV